MSEPVYRFSGHESFSCRYAWIPKAVEAIQNNASVFSNIDEAMVQLGLGKNMVQSLRFWVQVMGVADSKDGRDLQLTEFGAKVFGPEGLDPYLEDVTTLWLLHWKLCAQSDSPLFAWDFLFNRYNAPEIVRSHVLKVIEREARQLARPLSPTTLAQHFDVLMHTYVPTRGKKGGVLEDNLDCPLVELELIELAGVRINSRGIEEPAFAFRREPKADLNSGAFVYALLDFWDRCRPGESALSLSEIANGIGSPGQVFKLPEDDLRRRLAQIDVHTENVLTYTESAMLEQVQRNFDWEFPSMLESAYETESANV